MRRLLTPFLTALTMATMVLAVQPAVAEAAAGANNVVIVTNTTEGASTSRAHIQIARDPADTVANQNVAIARSTDCTSCRTVSVAMQVVLVEGVPSDVEPANAASATNGGCTTCQTFAYAFQYLLQPGTMVMLDGDAQADIAALRQEVQDVAASDLGPVEMQAQLEDLFAQLVGVVNTQMQAVGASTDGRISEDARVA